MSSRRGEIKPHSQRPSQPRPDDDTFQYENQNSHPTSPEAAPRRIETNPHFLRPLNPPPSSDVSRPPPESLVPPYDDGRHMVAPPVHHHSPISPRVPHIDQGDRRSRPPSRPQRGKTKDRPRTSPPKDRSARPISTVLPVSAPTKYQSAPGISPPVPPTRDTEVGPAATHEKHDPQRMTPRARRGQRLPPPQKTHARTWFVAVFCVIFWLIIIVGGLIVLIVYLVFRPQSPHFDVSSVTLNAAYLDLGYLLNADITVLANFTNPNKKVHVRFSSMIINLYYGSTLIATQYVEPFSAAKATSRFAAIHMVSSQVGLPLKESQRLMKQMETNGVLFDVKGIFRATSKLGSILTYSYNLYGLCNIMVTRPPDGVLIKRKCRTKR